MKTFSIFVIIAVMLTGCATTKQQVSQDKTFEMTCPAEGCKFTSLVMYAPRAQELHPALQVLSSLAPVAAQVFLGVSQIKATRDISIASYNAFTGMFDKAGGNISSTTSTTTNQTGTFVSQSFNGDNRQNPSTSDNHSTDNHTVNPTPVVQVVPTVIQPVIQGVTP